MVKIYKQSLLNSVTDTRLKQLVHKMQKTCEDLSLILLDTDYLDDNFIRKVAFE